MILLFFVAEMKPVLPGAPRAFVPNVSLLAAALPVVMACVAYMGSFASSR